MKTVQQWLLFSEAYLKARGVSHSRIEGEEILAYVLEKKRSELPLHFSDFVETDRLSLLEKVLKRRGLREPLQYIFKTLPFAGVSLEVNPHVLIPRPETELLVEKVGKVLEKESLEGKVLWDICSGSGCLGIALKAQFPALEVHLSDISSPALEVARSNALLNGVEVFLHQGDLFSPFLGQHCDYFVCNPPYVTQEEFLHLSPEVRDFEPKIALVSGETGLEMYQKIAQDLPTYLRGRGWLEIGSLQAEGVLSLFKKRGYSQAHIEKDWCGRQRFCCL